MKSELRETTKQEREAEVEVSQNMVWIRGHSGRATLPKSEEYARAPSGHYEPHPRPLQQRSSEPSNSRKSETSERREQGGNGSSRDRNVNVRLNQRGKRQSTKEMLPLKVGSVRLVPRSKPLNEAVTTAGVLL